MTNRIEIDPNDIGRVQLRGGGRRADGLSVYDERRFFAVKVN